MSMKETPRSVNAVRRCMDPARDPPDAMSTAHHSAMKTSQSKYGPTVLISATATRVNGRIAITPRVNMNAREKRWNTVTETPSKTPISLNATFPRGRRLPMNMVVSQVASRRAASPVEELYDQRFKENEELAPLDPLLDHLLNFNTPGPKTGSLPHPDDLMGARSRNKFRRFDGPEDEIHKAFVSIYGVAEAGLSAGKKLRMSRNYDEDSVSETCGKSNQVLEYNKRLPITHHPAQEHDSSSHVPPAAEANTYYDELYGFTPRSRAAVAMRTKIPNSPSEIWKPREASSPSRNFVSSHNFLNTASDLRSTKQNNSYHDPPQESTWKKYMNNKDVEKADPWVTESLGNSNKKHRDTDFLFKPYTSEEHDFKFMYHSPTKPGTSPALGQNARVQTKARKQSEASDLPESAECRWLYQVSPHRDVTPPQRRRYEDLPREDNNQEDDEIVNLLLQAEKESLFSSTPTECSGENKDDFYNYSSEE